jgi:hypothetical protein
MIGGKRSRSGLLGNRLLALLLVGTFLLCHGVLGALHLCSSPQTHLHQEHGHPAVEEGMGAHDEDSSCHASGADYFAVLLTAFLVLGLLLEGVRSWIIRVVAPSTVGRCFTPVVLHPPRGPTLPVLQVFRL